MPQPRTNLVDALLISLVLRRHLPHGTNGLIPAKLVQGLFPDVQPNRLRLFQFLYSQVGQYGDALQLHKASGWTALQ